MKRISLFVLFIISLSTLHAQDDYQRYMDSVNRAMKQMVDESKNELQQIQKEYKSFIEERTAEFAEFIANEWKLFEDFKAHQLSMTMPKLKNIPSAKEKALTDAQSSIEFASSIDLPKITHATATEYDDMEDNSYLVRKRLDNNGVQELSRPSASYSHINGKLENDVARLNFYGRLVDIPVSPELMIHAKGTDEKEISEYITDIAKYQEESRALWQELANIVNNFGLNEWGYFCLLRSLSEVLFPDNMEDRVLFCFYMLRNEGNYKTRIARGKDTGKLTLLLALDNNKEVYSYIFFRFDDSEDGKNKVKYYAVYGGGNADESVYSYDFCEQDVSKKQMSLDFYNILNMGECDRMRKIDIKKVNKSIDIPYNSAHLAYLDDVPMTIFPIYFVSPLSIEAQQSLNKGLEELKRLYNPVQFIEILLNMVQTGFDYKTDEEQFGYEKYFYPEEVIGYPYSDCEDRSALFSWLVTTYTNAQVIGLQYEGHISTAVYFGNDADIDGDAFNYAGKKYYVCDPTYTNASIGMTMPQFKNVTPKIIKITQRNP